MAITINGSGTLSGVTAGLTSSSMPTGSILQVVQTHLTTEVAMTGNDWDDIAGLTVAITPSAASSKILFMTSIDWAGGTYARIKFAKDIGGAGYNDLPLPTVDGNKSLGHLTHNCYGAESDKGNGAFTYLDSPNTTSAVTYKAQMYGTGRVNFPGNGGNSTTYSQGITNLIAMEIKG
mgnify:FL=1|tara:strand:- start:753 stop:1283 length:531 start_codon:yes stop_codon:yes gene_type:complete